MGDMIGRGSGDIYQIDIVLIKHVVILAEHLAIGKDFRHLVAAILRKIASADNVKQCGVISEHRKMILEHSPPEPHKSNP